MKTIYITTASDLEKFCAANKTAKFLSIDTEFVREKTYYPKLCLIQICNGKNIFLIDPLPENLDLTPLKDLFFSPDILKIFHASRQDLEIFHTLWQAVPAPVCDTQMLAMVCGFGENISYEKLVGAIANEKLDKAMQYTNWAQRPLLDRQIEYAAADVLYLRQIQEKLSEMAGPKIEWLKEEQSNLEAPTTYDVAPENAWMRLKVRYNMSPVSWGVLRAVAGWREELAKSRDVPRSHVMKDDIVVTLAMKMPKTESDLSRVKEMPPLKADTMASLFEAIKGATPFDNPLPKKPADTLSATLDLLKILLKIKSEEHRIVSRLIASTNDLEGLLLGQESLPLLQGWRRELFGEDAQKLLQGKLTICLDTNLKPIVQHM